MGVKEPLWPWVFDRRSILSMATSGPIAREERLTKESQEVTLHLNAHDYAERASLPL